MKDRELSALAACLQADVILMHGSNLQAAQDEAPIPYRWDPVGGVQTDVPSLGLVVDELRARGVLPLPEGKTTLGIAPVPDDELETEAEVVD